MSELEDLYFKQLTVAWDAYMDLVERNMELVKEIRRLNEELRKKCYENH